MDSSLPDAGTSDATATDPTPGSSDAPPGSGDAAEPAAALPAKALDTTPESPWPVRVLSEKIQGYIDRMPPVWVSGQLVEIKRRQGAWFTYVTLRDANVDVSMSLTITKKVLAGVDAELTDGAEVVAQVKPSYWQRRGSLSMQVNDIRMAGMGDLLARIERLKKTLAAEGLFDDTRKQPLPFLPRTIGLVCGRESAAERDVVVTARTRWPGVRFDIRTVPVQGPTAAKAVIGAVTELENEPGVDVIIIARGGGSLEDLLPFSDEALCRHVAACTKPTVSAIGHEVDCPVMDWVADVRASTPTDAGRRVVPAVAEELQGVAGARDRLRRAVSVFVQREGTELAAMRRHPALTHRTARLDREADQVATARNALRQAVAHRVTTAGSDVAGLRGRLRALSPLSTLQRGYAVMANADGVVCSAADVSAGDALTVTVADGQVAATADSAKTVPPGESPIS